MEGVFRGELLSSWHPLRAIAFIAIIIVLLWLCFLDAI
jgi:hypothetical protein